MHKYIVPSTLFPFNRNVYSYSVQETITASNRSLRIHFTGGNVRNILRSYGITDDMRVIPVGTSLEYERIFKRAIQELQRCRPDYQEMLVLLLRHLLIAIRRQPVKEPKTGNEYLDAQMELASQYFNDHYK